MTEQLIDILITVVEIGVLIFTFLLLNWLMEKGINAIARRWLKGRSDILATQRQNISIILLLACVIFCVVVACVNGVQIYQGKDLRDFQLGLIRSIPTQFWMRLAVAVAKSISLLLLVKLSLPTLHQFLNWASTFAKNYDRIRANDESVGAFFTALQTTLTTSIWVITAILCTQFLYFPAIIPEYLTIGLKIYVVIAIGRLIIKIIPAVVDTLDALSLQFSSPNNLLRYYERVRHLIPLLKKCLEYILYVGIATLVVQSIDFIAWIATYADEIVGIIAVYFLCGVLIETANVLLEEFTLRAENLVDIQRQRRLTVIPLIRSSLKYSICFAGGIAVLNIIHIDPTPILAGVGILGLAIGFGAQSLINDIVCGFFILFENYYLVGDFIEAGPEERPLKGVVEAIELRTTHIRHPDGQLQIINNGMVGSITNYSKRYTYAAVDIPVAYSVDLDRVYALIETVGQQLKLDYPDVLEPTQVEGLDDFLENSLLIRTVTKVKPGKHLYIQRLVRKMLKKAFDQAEISISSQVEA